MLSVLFYLAAFALVFIIQIIAMRQKNRLFQKILIFASFLIILLLIGFRYMIGTDYASYVDIYYGSYENSSFSEVMAKGTDVGMKLIFGLTPHVFGDVKAIFWIYGLLTLYPIYKINKNSNFKYLAYSTLIFNLTILPVCLNIMRQGAAMSFALLAFDYLRRDSKVLKVLLCMAIAIMLHMSAFLVIPFLVVYMFVKKCKKKFYIWSFILIALVSIALNTFLKDLFVEVGLSNYNYMLDISGSINVYGGAFLYNLIYYVMLVTVMLVYKKEKKSLVIRDTNEGMELAMIVNGTIFDLIGTMTKYLSRVSYYFSIYQIILLPEVFQNIINKNSRVAIKIFCISTLVVLFIFRCYIQGFYEIIPYQTWLF